jgi:hypothetical protein
MYRHPTNHPLDVELVDFVDGKLNDDSRILIENHLTICLLCRIKLQRLRDAAPIEFADVRHIEVPRFERVEAVETDSSEVLQGEVWLTSSDEPMLVLVRSIRNDDSGVVVTPVTLDVRVADDGCWILDKLTSPLTVPIVIYDNLRISLPSTALASRVVPLNSRLDLLSLSTDNPGVSRGSPLEGPGDLRYEVRQFLVDHLTTLEAYDPSEVDEDFSIIEDDNRLAQLRSELELRRGGNCEVQGLRSLPTPSESPRNWRGFAIVREFSLRILVIDTDVGLVDANDHVAARAIFTRLDGSALAVCYRNVDTVDFYDAPSLFHAFELPDGLRRTQPTMTGLSLTDAVAKFLDQQRSPVSNFGISRQHVARVNVPQILVEQVNNAVDGFLVKAIRYGREKREGFMALGGVKGDLTELLKSALEPDFDPQSIVAFIDSED